MPLLQIVSTAPLAGKTTVAILLAQGFAAAGRQVHLVRAGGEDASDDAETFASYSFATSPGRPLPPGQIKPQGPDIVIVEADAGSETIASAGVILVTRGGGGTEDVALGKSLGDRLIGTIATLVVLSQVEDVARGLTNAGLRPLALLPENATLAAPNVDQIREALGAEVLHQAEDPNAVAENVVVAPVYSDPAQPHFAQFDAMAVLTPSYKTDLQLAAITSRAVCLVVTGGGRPSPYVLDRAQGENTTILLAKQQTPAAVTALSEVWTRGRFRGAAKAAAVLALLAGRIDFGALARKLG